MEEELSFFINFLHKIHNMNMYRKSFVSVCPCYVHKTTEWILIRSGIGGLHYNLSNLILVYIDQYNIYVMWSWN
jgi:hypothetical protein